jgi:hypothetical protein
VNKPHRTASPISLRPIGLPRPLVVREDQDHTPLAITRASVRTPQRMEIRVESIEEQWRLAEAWWREASQARTYYRVILEGGRPLTLFRDDVTGMWSEQPYTAPGKEISR